MVRLYNSGIACTAFDNIGVNRTLYKKIDLAYLLCFFLKYTDEFFADGLSLCFGVGYTFKLADKTVCGIYSDEVYIPVLKRLLDLVALVLSHKAVINEHAG